MTVPPVLIVCLIALLVGVIVAGIWGTVAAQ